MMNKLFLNLVTLGAFAALPYQCLAADCSATGVEQVKCRIDAAKTAWKSSHPVPPPKIRKTLLTDETMMAELGGGSSSDDLTSGSGAPAPAAPAPEKSFSEVMNGG